MIKTIDRYILRAFFTNYLIALGVLVSLYVVLDLFVNLDEFTQIRTESVFQTMAKIADFYGHNLFLYFAQLSGVIILFAACFTLGRLHRTNELTALLASGTSLFRVAAPIMLAALAMNAIWFIDQEFIIPGIAPKLARKHADIEGRRTIAIWFLPDHDGRDLVSAAQFHPGLAEMRGLVVLRRDEGDRLVGAIVADQAKWDRELARWSLLNGESMNFDASREAAPSEGVDLGRRLVSHYVSDLTPNEMGLLQAAASWQQLMSLRDLERLQERFESPEFMKIKHIRLTTVLINMTLLALGIPFFLNRERVPVLVAGGKCLLSCGVCFVFTFTCQYADLAALGLPPALPAWLPVIIFGPVAVLMMDAIKT